MIRPDPAKIVVPRKHGEVLIEPGMEDLSILLRISREYWRESGLVAEWRHTREEARRGMVSAAREWAKLIGAEGPGKGAEQEAWVVTGHQLEFYHAGVWAKVVAADGVARRAGAVAFDLLVDHDLVERCGLEVPLRRGGAEGQSWERVGVEVMEASSLPAEFLEGPGMEAFERWDGELAEYEAAGTDTMAFVLSSLRAGIGCGAEQRRKVGYTEWMSGARAGFERSMGLSVHHVPATWVCRGDVWEWFVSAWVENAEKWTEVYNRKLGEYRKRAGIKSAQHPMPDLARDVGRGEFELPFWCYRAGEARERLVVGRGWKREEGMLIRPRALTLTMYVRLFLADLFIHGIGGALYDQITDGILQELFGVMPASGCVSAAWLLPIGRAGEAEDVAALKWRRHHAVHNPRMYMDSFTAQRQDVAEIDRNRRLMLSFMADSLASKRRDKAARAERREWFDLIHDLDGFLHKASPGVLKKMDRELAEARRAAEQNKVVMWREYFWGLHARASLAELVGRIGGD